MQKKTTAFTLVEILVAIAIITILAGLILSGGNKAREKAKKYQVMTMISSLETALALYHADFGAYPISGNQNLVNFLANAGAYGTNNQWQGPYMNFKTRDLNGVIPNATVIDAWGNDYYYNLQASPPPDYKIWSRGLDGVDNLGGGDDIKSW